MQDDSDPYGHIAEARAQSLIEFERSNKKRKMYGSQSDRDLDEGLRISLQDTPTDNSRNDFCDAVSVGTSLGLGYSVLQDSVERVNVDFERTYRETREFSVHGVPGDGSCFFHAVIEGMRQSSHLWKTMINRSPLPGDPVTFCDLIVRWWSRYVTTVPGLVNEDNIHDHLNFKFLRYITAESITDENYSTYAEIVEFEKNVPVSSRMLTPYNSKEDLKKAVKNKRSCWADDFTTNVLNEALSPFLKVVIVNQSPGSPGVRTFRHSDNKAMSYMWVLLRGSHYNLLRKTGSYEPSGGDFIEKVPSNDASMLKYVRSDWC